MTRYYDLVNGHTYIKSDQISSVWVPKMKLYQDDQVSFVWVLQVKMSLQLYQVDQKNYPG